MVGYAQSHQKDDEPERYNEVISSRPLADAFKDKGMLRGSFAINGRMYHNFESNGPDNFIPLVNAKAAETGVKAELTEDGHVKLSHQSPQPILLTQGPAYYPPVPPGEKLPTDLPPNTILEDIGFEETEEARAAMAAQMRGNGLVGQVGDGRVVSTGEPTLDEINKRSLEAQNKGTGGRAPHAPHESVPGTTTTGDTPQRVSPASNAERVSRTDVEEATPPGGGRQTSTVAAGRVGAMAPTDTMNDGSEMTDAEEEADPDYRDRTVADLREHARQHDINLQGASTKADVIRAIKKHDRKAAKEQAKQ